MLFFDKYSESDKSSSSEWDTFLSNKQEEISKKLASIGFDIIPEDIKSSLIHLFKSRGINGMDDITDITLIEEKTILDKINNNFKKVKEVLSAGTGENNIMSRVYYPEECGAGDRDRRRDRYCEKRDETCFARSGMHRINCGTGMLIDLSSGPHRRCGCMYPMMTSSAINVNY